MPLQSRYEADRKRLGWSQDPAQENAIKKLSQLQVALLNPAVSTPQLSWFKKLLGNKPPPELPGNRGLYLWGGVGRGKTYLLDTFFETLPFQKKLRIHFHHFMRDVHQQRKSLGDIEEPLLKIAENYAEKYRVICFDEFLVNDITDAMILSKLLGAMFVQGVVLVTTSNFAPDDLYKDGFQRDRFLPAIELIKRFCEVLSVDNGTDYRLLQMIQSRVVWDASDDNGDEKLQEFISQLSPGITYEPVSIEINGRYLNAKATAHDLVWFDFDELCNQPVGAADYIELACEYSTVVLSGIYGMSSEHDDIARRFITLIDAMYDRHTRVIFSMSCALADLYIGERLAFEFARTQSRVHDMQSERYLSHGHQL